MRVLAYYPGHIALFVEKGGFSSENRYEVRIGDRDYVLAETTAANFVIGQSVLEGDFSSSEIELLQDPESGSVMNRFGQET